MANYKLITHVSTGLTSELMFTAGATNTVVSSITAKDGSGQTAEVLVQKAGAGTIIEMAEVDLTSNAGFQIIDVAFALEATDKLYIRATRGGMTFIMSYVEETEVPNDTALGGLADVSTSGATDGQSLVYSSTSSQWEPSTITGGGGGSGASNLDGLSDVAITSSSSGDFLKHNGSNYVDVNFDAAVNANATVIANSAKVEYSTALFNTDFATKDADDINDNSTTHRFVTATQQATLGNLAPVTTALDLEDMADDIAVNNAKTSYTDSAAVATNTLKNSYPTADANKLALIDAGATANDTDANLKNRANHTGTQLSSTISDFTAETETIIADVIGNTDDVSEGTTNLYHTTARVDARIGAADIADLNNVSSTSPSSGQVLKWNGSAWAPAADNSSSGGAGGVVDSVNGISQAAVVLDADDIDDAATAHKFTTASDITKLAGIASNATANDTDVNLKNRSNHTGQQASSTISDFGAASAAVIVATNLQSLANVDTPTTGEFLKWNGSTWETDTAGGGAVDSVNTQTGVVVLDADDIDDSSTTHKFVSAADITKLGGIAAGAEVNAVDSVNTQTGAVVLDADDIDDASTTHKFVTAGDVTKLGNITIANPLNLDTMNALSGLAFTAANQAASDITSHTNSLRNHSDINYTETNPANIPAGSFLTWDGSTQWIDGLIDLQDLNNVDTPTTGEYLKWNGSDWVTDTPAGGGGGSGPTIQDADTALSAAGNYEDGARLLKLVNTNTTLTAGKVYILKSNGWDASTNASAAGSSGMIAMCSSNSNTGSEMILEGVCRTRLIITSASIGDPVYLGTGSEFTLTAPTSSATVLQLGTVVDPTNNMIYFNPDKTTITLQ